MSQPGNAHWKVEADRRPERAGQTTRRYVGRPKRGRQPVHVDDDLDLRLAISELVAARELLATAHLLPIRLHRRAAVRSAVAKVALAGRLIDSLVERRLGVACDCVEVTP